MDSFVSTILILFESYLGFRIFASTSIRFIINNSYWKGQLKIKVKFDSFLL